MAEQIDLDDQLYLNTIYNWYGRLVMLPRGVVKAMEWLLAKPAELREARAELAKWQKFDEHNYCTTDCEMANALNNFTEFKAAVGPVLKSVRSLVRMGECCTRTQCNRARCQASQALDAFLNDPRWKLKD